jgi:hypothetical protein
MRWTPSNPDKYAVPVLDPPPNHPLQRTGGQRRFRLSGHVSGRWRCGPRRSAWGVRAPSEAWRFLAGGKSLRSTAEPATQPECCRGEGGHSRTTQLKRTQGIPQTVGKTALPDA